MIYKSLLKASALVLGLLCFHSAHAEDVHSFQAAMTPVQKGVTTAELAASGVKQFDSIHWVTTESVIKTINHSKPGVVGFDVDDTVLFNSPGFVAGKNKYSPGSNQFTKNPDFWKDMNNGWDQFDIPKNVAMKLIHAYQQHGDRIYFITARPKTAHETLSQTIQSSFGITHMNPVIFFGNKDKSPEIKKLGITTFYGDADEDIASAKAAGAEGIRIMRAENSTNLPQPLNGKFGEKVIINSQY